MSIVYLTRVNDDTLPSCFNVKGKKGLKRNSACLKATTIFCIT